MQQWAKWVLGIVAVVMAAGIIGGLATLSAHGERIASVETRQESQGDIAKETRSDVKLIRSVVDRMAGRLGVKGSGDE